MTLLFFVSLWYQLLFLFIFHSFIWVFFFFFFGGAWLKIYQFICLFIKPTLDFIDLFYFLSLFYLFPLWSLLLLPSADFGLCLILLIPLHGWLGYQFENFVSWGRLISLWTFLLALLLLKPIDFGLLCFHYNLFLCIFWFPFWFLHLYIGYSEACCLASMSLWFLYFFLLFSSVFQSCPTLWNPMDCSTSGFPVNHQLQELSQTHVHLVSDAIQPSHPLLFTSPPSFSLFQHQDLFKWVSSSYQVAKLLELQLQHQSFQWIFRTDFLYDWLARSPCSPRGSQESSPAPKFKSISSSVLSFLYSPTLTSIHDYWKNHSFDQMKLCWQRNVSAF